MAVVRQMSTRPGLSRAALGLLHHAPRLGWRDVDVAGIVQAHVKGSPLDGLPLCMQNEANFAALGEFEFADQASTDPLIYLSIGYGVGAGVIVNDRLLTGLHAFAGEAGHAILQTGGPACSCGRRGCADALIGLVALLGAERPSHPALDRLFRRVADGDPATCAAVDASGRQLGVLLNNLPDFTLRNISTRTAPIPVRNRFHKQINHVVRAADASRRLYFPPRDR